MEVDIEDEDSKAKSSSKTKEVKKQSGAEPDEKTPDGEKSKPSVEIRKEDILSLVSQLKSSSGKTIYSALHKIRNKVIQNDVGISTLHDCGGFKYLVKLLSVSSEEVLNIVISILGNCCSRLVSNQDLRDEVLKLEIAPRIVSILRKVTNEGVHKRTCRLIGNLAQAHNLAVELHKSNAAIAVITVLNTTNSIYVKQMAVRALRWLWETEKYHGEMLKAGAVKSVATLLDTAEGDLKSVVLRALVVFTQLCSIGCAEQVRGVSGNGYSQIVGLMNLPIISVLIYNLSQSPPARVELSKVGVVPRIIKKLGDGKMDSYLINALCLMCRESMVRASLRGTESGFETLLSVLSNRKARMFHLEVLNAITQFNYDQQSLMMMVRAGLIETLVGKLREFTETHGVEHEEEASEGGEVSPASPSTSCSPPHSHPTHLLYSPRCSSPEPEEQDDLQSSLIDAVQAYTEKFPEGPTGEDGCILEVLSQLTYQNVPLGALASKTTIHTFLDYLVTTRYPQNRQNYLKASKTLCAIVQCKHYYNVLLEEESILAIHRELCRGRHRECSSCERLEQTGRTVLGEAMLAAQSGLGEGEMSYRLATASDLVKSSVALTIPHVVRQPNLMYNLLFGQNAFQWILDCLDTRIEEAVPALHQLFTTLCIKNPQTPMQTCAHCDVANVRKEGNVSFRLDDGSTVMGNRESLSHNCPMFEAMFRGGFKESQQTTIRITDISSDCLQHLTRLADEYCQCVLPKDLPTLLEMITATDRFLLPELTEKIVKFVMNCALNQNTGPEIYDWGLRVGFKLEVSAGMSMDALRYLMAGDMPCQARVHATSIILHSPNRHQFISDLTEIVKTGVLSYTKTFRFIQRNW